VLLPEAASLKSKAVRCLVQELGADVSQTCHGDTPLMIAAAYGFPDLVRLLVTDLGADINQGNPHGEAPLYLTSSRGHLDVVKMLVAELGAEAGAVDNYVYTALLESALDGQLRTMQYLLEDAGANMDDVSNKGETVWDLLTEPSTAVAEGRAETNTSTLTGLLRVLVLRGAPPPALVALLSPSPRAWCRRGHGCGRGSRRTSCGGGPSWTRTARCCPRSGPWCTATWSSPPPRSSGPRG
jgi:hypothetical protein